MTKNKKKREKPIIKKKYLESKQEVRLKIPWLIIFSIAAVLLLIFLFDPRTFLGGDNCHYMSLGQSILHKHYHIEALIGSPSETGPPGYPFILAISLAVFGRTFMPAKIFSFLCFLVSIFVWWKLFNRQGTEKRTAIALLVFSVLNPLIAEFSHWELTEAPFMLISSVAILVYFIALQKRSFLFWIITAILAVGAFYIRIAGICLPIAISLALLMQRKWKEFAIYSIIVFILILPWLARFIIVGKQVGGGIYIPQFITNQSTGELLSISGFINKVFGNLSRYLFVNLPTLFLPIGQETFANQSGLGVIIGLFFLATIFLGIIQNIRSKQNLYSIYVILTILMLISFSELAAIVRYLVVIYPFIAILFILGLEKFFVRIKQKTFYIFGVILVITLLSIPSYFKSASKNSSILLQYLKGNQYAELEPNLINFIEVNKWIKENDTTSVGVISRKPTLTWWFSGHPSRSYLWRTDVNLVKANIDSLGAKYVIVDQISGTTQQFLIPTIRAFPQNFKVLYVTQRPETYVLEFIRNP